MSGKEKLLITGGLGNLGSWLSEHFSSKYDLYILSKNLQNKLRCPYTLIHSDITDINDLKNKLNLQFDYCIHAASYNELFHENYPIKALEINSLGTRNLIEVLKNTKIKNFIYLSTFHVYGSKTGVINENTHLDPNNDYATTHLFAEYYLKQFFNTHNFQSIIFRLTNSYGAPKHIHTSKWYLILNNLVKLAFEKQEIVLKGDGSDVRDLIWMGDVCSVIEKSLINPVNDVFNLSSGRSYNMMELAKKVQKIYENRYKKKIEIIAKVSNMKKNSDLSVDNGKLKKYINFEFKDNIDQEIISIFKLLEESKY